MDFINRGYRDNINKKEYYSFNVCVLESDLYISLPASLKENIRKEIEEKSVRLVRKLRENLYKANENIDGFFVSLKPCMYNSEIIDRIFQDESKRLINNMLKVSLETETGPMASVAGGISQIIGEMIKSYTDEYIVENGGDIYLSSTKEKTVSVYAGKSDISNKIGIKLKPEKMPLSVCTSSAKIGRSLSMGNADVVTVVAGSAFLADALATQCGNILKKPENIKDAIDYIKNDFDIQGIFIIIEGQIGVWGNIEICKV
jgi:ApbE superfamily uncharacterized protein (UPF0280 family)